MALVLSRREGESVRVGDAIILIRKCSPSTTQISIDAPRDVLIIRTELEEADEISGAEVGYENYTS